MSADEAFGDVNDADGDDVVYEAGDVNTVGGSGAVADDEYDDEYDDGDEFVDEADDEADDLVDGAGDAEEAEDEEADEADEGNAIDDANRTTGGTPQAVLTYLARSLAGEPDEVVVESEERRGELVLRLSVAPDDMGRVIGRRGRTAQAIRTLVNVAGARDGIRTSVDIIDD
jgi:predicted RNA-binding protein YlqC (UPF0109 family)